MARKVFQGYMYKVYTRNITKFKNSLFQNDYFHTATYPEGICTTNATKNLSQKKTHTHTHNSTTEIQEYI